MQYKRCGLCNAEKKIMLQEARAHGGPELTKRTHDRHMAMVDTHKAETRGAHGGTRFGGAAKVDTRRTRGGHKADKGLEARPKWTQGGHMADKLQERGQSISRPASPSKREPHSKLFGE